jgi:hypothetical protein
MTRWFRSMMCRMGMHRRTFLGRTSPSREKLTANEPVVLVFVCDDCHLIESVDMTTAPEFRFR